MRAATLRMSTLSRLQDDLLDQVCQRRRTPLEPGNRDSAINEVTDQMRRVVQCARAFHFDDRPPVLARLVSTGAPHADTSEVVEGGMSRLARPQPVPILAEPVAQ